MAPLWGADIEGAGGRIEPDLTRASCTHLIALSADTPKFRAAERWGPEVVKTVRREWLTECLEKGGTLCFFSPVVPSTSDDVRLCKRVLTLIVSICTLEQST